MYGFIQLERELTNLLPYSYEVRVRNKNHVVAEIIEFVKKNYPNQAGIIYCESRSKCQVLSEVLEVQFYFYLYSYQIFTPLIIQ